MSYQDRYYFGSYGVIRGYGPLCRTMKEADDTVRDDHRRHRNNGGTTDRSIVAVSPKTGLCWWWDEDSAAIDDMAPVKTPIGEQARYSLDIIHGYEGLWGTLAAGFA